MGQGCRLAGQPGARRAGHGDAVALPALPVPLWGKRRQLPCSMVMEGARLAHGRVPDRPGLGDLSVALTVASDWKVLTVSAINFGGENIDKVRSHYQAETAKARPTHERPDLVRQQQGLSAVALEKRLVRAFFIVLRVDGMQHRVRIGLPLYRDGWP